MQRMVPVEQLLKILADRNRLRILNLLARRKLCVCELSYVIGIAQPSVSRHLGKLKSAGLVEEVQNSLWTDYTLTVESGMFKRLWALIQPLMEEDPGFQKDWKKLPGADRTKLRCR